MKLYKLLAVNNDCYKTQRTIIPKGVMWHSTGANNPKLKRYVGPDDGRLGINIFKNYWNRPKVAKCVHAFIGKLKDGSVATYQTLPWNHRGWHAGSGRLGTANNTHISFEICEDNLKSKDYAMAVYKEAVEVTAYLCKMFKLDPLGKNVIIDHAEGARLGIASNHGDVLHWFGRYGITLQKIRDDVAQEMQTPESKPDPSASTYTVKHGDSPWSIAAKELGDGRRYKEIEQLNGLTGTYYIYAGQVLTLPSSSSPTPAPTLKPYKVQVTAQIGLNYRSGPGTGYGKKGAFNAGQIVVIDKEQSGWGRVAGKGWISLEYVKKV